MSDEESTREVSPKPAKVIADKLSSNDGTRKPRSKADRLSRQQRSRQRIFSMISASNQMDVIPKSPPKCSTELLSSDTSVTPFRFFDLPIEVRIIIYHMAIGDRHLHIYSDCTVVPDRIVQCNDEDPHTCLESKLNTANKGFPFNVPQVDRQYRYSRIENVHCQGSVLLHNRICTSHGINTGDRNGYWSLSLSQDVETGTQTIDFAARDSPPFAHAKPLDYCPCVQRPKTSLSLNLLQTCKAVHEEAALIPYASNTFIFQEAETFAAFFGLVLPYKSSSNDMPTFASDRSDAIYNMRHVHLHTRAMASDQLLFVTRLLRAGLSLLTGLQTFELTLGILSTDMMSEWEIDDSLFGVSRSAEKVTVNIRNYVWMAAEFRVQGWKNLLSRGGREASVEEEREIAEKLIERMLKEDEFTNQKVPFFGPV